MIEPKYTIIKKTDESYVNMYKVDVKDILAYNHHEEEILTDNAKLVLENV